MLSVLRRSVSSRGITRLAGPCAVLTSPMRQMTLPTIKRLNVTETGIPPLQDEALACADAGASSTDAFIAHAKSANAIDFQVLHFNAHRRAHILENDVERRRRIERQAWRILQNLTEADADRAADRSIAMIIVSWSYFSRFWERGRDGPTDALPTAVDPSDPLEISVVVDHRAASLVDFDRHLSEDSSEADGLEGSEHASPTDNATTSTPRSSARSPKAPLASSHSALSEAPRQEVLDEVFE